jgi:hypothetical protein
MALRGNLKDFSLPDVFQLVTLSKKTGILRIRRADGAEGSVWFRDGDVFFAQSNWKREPLGERLVSADRITPAALSRALEIQRNEGAQGRRLGTILVEEGYISQKVLEAFVQEQIQDTIFDLFRWDEGDFDFESLEGAPDQDIGLSVSIENIVMEGSRRLEEWARIKKKIPSTAIVFKMATAPGEGTFEISLKPVEWALLLLVDGTRDVAELATDTGRTDFEVSRVLYGLFSAGLLEVASEEEVERLRGERVRLEARAAQLRGVAPAPPAAAPQPAAPAAAAPGQPAGGAPARTAEPDLPTFLSDRPAPAPDAEDMAVFDAMMGVLQTPAAPGVSPVAPNPPGEAMPQSDFIVSGPPGIPGSPQPPGVAPPMSAQPEPTIAELEAAALAGAGQSATGADLSDILSSLQQEGEGQAPVISTGTEGATADGAGVISTDAYLSDFEGGDTASTGLGDELTALTGGGRGPRPMNSGPSQPVEGGIKRDQMVDKDLVLKVIDGLKNL